MLAGKGAAQRKNFSEMHFLRVKGKNRAFQVNNFFPPSIRKYIFVGRANTIFQMAKPQRTI